MGFLDWLWSKATRTEPALLPSEPRILPASAAEPDAPLPAVQTAPKPPPKPPPPKYGIDNVITLMKALPLDDDPDLVLRVVRKTLRSTGVSVEEIVESGRKRESDLATDIANDRASIERLERDITALKANIEAVTQRMNDTRKTRERLQEAIESESQVGLLVAPAERARLMAEAAAAVSKPPPPNAEAPAPKPESPPLPKTSTAPAPKTGVPPPLVKKSVPTKPPPPLPSRSMKPGAAPAVVPPSAEQSAASSAESPGRRSEALTPVAQPVAPPVEPATPESARPINAETPRAPLADVPASGGGDDPAAKE